jgi:hypothetical protein
MSELNLSLYKLAEGGDLLELFEMQAEEIAYRVLMACESLIAEGQEEVHFQSKRVQTLKADLERLKDYCQRCMELIDWKPGKPRKLEGRSGYLLLKANGGRPAVEVTDEGLVPDELCTVTVMMRPSHWKDIKPMINQGPLASMTIGPRVPSLSLIAEALSQPCVECAGAGEKCCNPDHTRPTDCTERCRTCNYCGGSGKNSVPGARLKPQGAHVEVK